MSLFDKDQDAELDALQQQQQRSAETAPAPAAQPSRVAQLQSKLGNSRLLQLRSAIQKREGAPDWIRSQLGIGDQQEQNFERVTQARETAEQQADVSLPSGGQKLDPNVQQHAEDHLGVPLGDVNVVPGADSACDAMGAQAFASGNDVFLSSKVDTSTPDGQFTVMHELSHVAQQKKGETSGLEGLGGDEGKRETLENAADSSASKMLR